MFNPDLDYLSKMPVPLAPYEDEDARLEVLRSFDPDALEDDPELCAICNFAARLCGAPVSQITLVEDVRQRFLAREGIEERELPRSISFCQYTMRKPEIMEVRDARDDPRFAENPVVAGDPFVRYYAGHPLISSEGAPLGAICVVDLAPRGDGLTDFQREGMHVLANAVMRRLHSRRENIVAVRELERSAERFRALANSVPDIAFSTDGDGNFDYFNHRWLEFTGLEMPSAEEMGSKVVHPEEQGHFARDWSAAIASGETYEKELRLRRVDGEYMWMLLRATPVPAGMQGQHRWFGTITDVDASYKLSESRDLLAKELSHRIKNIFAVITGLISLQSRKAPEHKSFADTISQTLFALGRAHDFVRPEGGATQESLQGLLSVLFTPYLDDAGASRIRTGGVECAIAPDAATPLALIFHELATNASKYGALSVAGGKVELTAHDEGENLRLSWTEIDGPPPPKQVGESGFGSRMVEMAVTGQLQGSWERRFEKSGLEVDVTLSKQAIAP